MTFPFESPHQHGSDSAGFSEIARADADADADYRRLRQAYLELAQGELNEVAMAMVGADMERANSVLQRLGGLRPLSSTHEPARPGKRAARRLAEENA